MKSSKTLIVLTVAALCASCQYTTPPVGYSTAPGYPSDPTRYPSAGAGDTAQYFRAGSEAGGRDAKKGIAANPSAHWKSVPPAYRKDFNRGYSDGYRNVKTDTGAQQAGYFQRGRAIGSADKRSGRRYDPSRHFANIQPQYRDEFTRGYAAGWQ
jgi:hypothetical protein